MLDWEPAALYMEQCFQFHAGTQLCQIGSARRAACPLAPTLRMAAGLKASLIVFLVCRQYSTSGVLSKL